MTRLALALCCLVPAMLAAPGEVEIPSGPAAEVLRAAGTKGGLVVLLGAGDGSLAAGLARDGRFLVHGLDPDADKVATARKALQALGVYGQASVEQGALAKLPYSENLVNLAVAGSAEGLSLEEAFRVLAPNGVLLVRAEGIEAKLKAAGFDPVAAAPELAGWVRAEKPRPAEMDDWPQWAHGADRNPVSKDKLAGPPTRLRWLTAPWMSRAHTTSNLSAVSAGGRIFYQDDEAEPRVGGPGRLYLAARDAHNGLLLWKRKLLVPLRGTVEDGRTSAYYGPRSMPATDGERVYATLEPGGPLAALDAATGRTVWTTEKSLLGSPYDLLLHEGAVLVTEGGTLSSLDPKTGVKKWSVKGGGSLVAGEGRVFMQGRDGGPITCLDARTGNQSWRKDPGRGVELFSCVSGVLVCRGGRGVHHGVSAKDGALLWTHQGGMGIPYVVGGLVWIPQCTGRGSIGPLVAIDLVTGAEKKRVEFRSGKGTCLAPVPPATERYHIYGRHDYVERETGRNWFIRSTRAVCGFNLLPANGLIYTWPVDCRCYPMLSGVMGLAPSETPLPDPAPGQGGWGKGGKTNAAATPLPPVANVLDAARLQKGPAGPAALKPGPEDWPTWRHDPERSGCSPTRVPAEVKLLWERELGGGLTPPSAACGLVFVASRDGQQVHALDAAGGRKRWSYALGGPVDTPPTVHEGLCLFGSRDGWVYALNAADGGLVWRFRAAPRERRIIAFERLESAWPVYGSVLVTGGTAYLTAGRHTHLDGGCFVYAADPATGKVLWHTRAEGNAPCDVPVKGPTTVQVWAGQLKFDLKTGKQESTGKEDKDALQAPMLLLNPVWGGGRSAWFRGDVHGDILVLDGPVTYGVVSRSGKNDVQVVGKEGYELFAAQGRARTWSVTVPVRMRGLAKAGELLFAAGPPDVADPKDYWAAFDGKLGGRLLAFSAKDGKKLSEMNIDGLPVPDGLIAANGRLYLSTRSGKILCFGK